MTKFVRFQVKIIVCELTLRLTERYFDFSKNLSILIIIRIEFRRRKLSYTQENLLGNTFYNFKIFNVCSYFKIFKNLVHLNRK